MLASKSNSAITESTYTPAKKLSPPSGSASDFEFVDRFPRLLLTLR